MYSCIAKNTFFFHFNLLMKEEKIPSIWKIAIKEYKFFKTIILKGAIITFIIFLLCLIKNPVNIALYISLFVWLMMLIIYSLLIYKGEYYDKKKVIKKLLQNKYIFFREQNFEIIEGFYLQGKYKDFSILVIPRVTLQKRKIGLLERYEEIEYDQIIIFYTYDGIEDLVKKEKQMSGEYHIGKLYFRKKSVLFFVPHFEKPDFKDILDSLINILKREDLKPSDFPKKENE